MNEKTSRAGQARQIRCWPARQALELLRRRPAGRNHREDHRQEFGDYLEQNISPAAMKDTGFWLTEQIVPRRHRLHPQRQDQHVDVSKTEQPRTTSTAPARQNRAAAVSSTLHDYVRFTQMLLNKGELDGKRILKPKPSTT
jgi:CubicO group peptidase (beta-lactamase class C family)